MSDLTRTEVIKLIAIATKPLNLKRVSLSGARFFLTIFILNFKTMKNFFLLVTIILSFNLSAQYKLSGGGVFVTFSEDGQNLTVKWSNNNNQVVTKTATFVTPKVATKYAQYKIKNSGSYFLFSKAILGDGFNIDYYNELGSLYWNEMVWQRF
jgi:hypothetical protein